MPHAERLGDARLERALERLSAQLLHDRAGDDEAGAAVVELLTGWVRGRGPVGRLLRALLQRQPRIALTAGRHQAVRVGEEHAHRDRALAVAREAREEPADGIVEREATFVDERHERRGRQPLARRRDGYDLAHRPVAEGLLVQRDAVASHDERAAAEVVAAHARPHRGIGLRVGVGGHGHAAHTGHDERRGDEHGSDDRTGAHRAEPTHA